MNLSGNLKELSLPDILQLVQQQRKSGVLHLSQDDGKRQAELFLSQGNIAAVRLNGSIPEDKVRDLLLASGRIGDGELSDWASAARDLDRSLLSMLEAKGLLTSDEKAEWTQIACEDMVCELFSWAEGRYEFSTNSRELPPGSVRFDIPPEFVSMEGMRRLDELPRLKQSIPEPAAVFRKTGKALTEAGTGWEARILDWVDGERTLEQIGKRTPFGSFRLLESFVNLWGGGYIVPTGETKLNPEGPAAARPKASRRAFSILGISILIFVLALAFKISFLRLHGRDALGSEAGHSRALSGKAEQVILLERGAPAK